MPGLSKRMLPADSSCACKAVPLTLRIWQPRAIVAPDVHSGSGALTKHDEHLTSKPALLETKRLISKCSLPKGIAKTHFLARTVFKTALPCQPGLTRRLWCSSLCRRMRNLPFGSLTKSHDVVEVLDEADEIEIPAVACSGTVHILPEA